MKGNFGMKVLVCGGRAYKDRDFVFHTLDAIHSKHHISILIHGGASGADSLAREWAHLKGVPCATVQANWARHGVAAGPIRNRSMLLLEPDAVIAFPGGRGTANMVGAAIDAAVPHVWQPKQ